MTSETHIERLARVMRPLAWENDGHFNSHERKWQRRMAIADVRAVLEALMEPTEEMVLDGAWHFGDAMKRLPADDYHAAKAKECWQAMLRAILNEEPQQ